MVGRLGRGRECTGGRGRKEEEVGEWCEGWKGWRVGMGGRVGKGERQPNSKQIALNLFDDAE